MSRNHRRRGVRKGTKTHINLKAWLLVAVAAAGICWGGSAGQALGVVPNFLNNASSGPSDFTVQERPNPSPEEPQEVEWNMVLVNPWNTLPEGHTVELTQLKNGQAVDSRCYPDLKAMLDDCREAGLTPIVCSSYRTQAKQERLFKRQVDKLLDRGYSQSDAEAKAGRSVAVPGTSEHQLGLAVDIVDVNNQNLNKSQEDTPVQKWLMEHCWDYGFILRYPNRKSDVTGIIYEPWHYRYVGKEVAQAMRDADSCLEEFLER